MSKLLKNAVVVVFGLIIAVVFMEAFFYIEPNFLPSTVRFASTSTFNLDLRETFKPNIDTLQTIDGGLFSLKTSDLGLGGIGFRDDGIKLDSKLVSSDTFAVAIGDSFVYGHGVNSDKTWTELLEEKTGREVVNMGEPAAFPETEEKILEMYASRLKPKVVIFGIFQNDWADKPSFDNEKKGFTLIKRTLDSYSSTYKIVRFILTLPSYQSYKNYPRYTNGSVDNYFYPLHLGPAVDDSDPSIMKGEQSMNESVLKAAQFAKDNGMQIVFVVFPSREQVYWDAAKQYAPKPDADINRMNEVVNGLCGENKLSCFDLTSTMIKNNDKQIFFPIDGHMNEVGHQIAADSIYSYLKQNGFLPA